MFSLKNDLNSHDSRLLIAKKPGFTLVELMIVIAIIGMLLALAMPAYIKNREIINRKLCIENLAQIESAKQQWGMEHAKGSLDEPAMSDLVGPALYLRQMPICPGGGTYYLNSIRVTATCTITGHTLQTE